MSDPLYPPGVYVKDGRTQTAKSPARAVALVFEGYSLRTAESAKDSDYRALQAQAKEAGISPKQSAAALVEALNAKAAEGAKSSDSALGTPPETSDEGALDSTFVETSDQGALDETSTDTDEN